MQSVAFPEHDAVRPGSITSSDRIAGRPWSLPVGGTFIAYLLVTAAASVWLPISEATQAALSIPALAVVPLLVGSALLRYLPIIDERGSLDALGRAVVEWFVGSVALTSLVVAFQLAGQSFLLQRFGLIALVLAGIAALARRAEPRMLSLRLAGPVALTLATVLLLSIAPKVLVARYLEFPLLTGNAADVALHFAQPALRMLEQGYVELQNPSHGPGVVTLLAAVAQLYSADPQAIIWMAPFLLFAVFGVGLFLWAREVSGNSTTAVLVGAIGVFLPVEPIYYSATPLVLRSNTILFTLFPFCLYLMHRLVTRDEASARAKAEGLLALQGTVAVLFIAMNAYRLGVLSQEIRVLLMLGVACVAGLTLAAVNRRRWQWAGLPALFLVIVGFQIFHIYEGPVFLTAFVVYGLALTMRNWELNRAFVAGLCLAVGAYFFLLYSGVVTFPDGFSISSVVFGSTYEDYAANFASHLDLLKFSLSPIVALLFLLGVGGFMVRNSDAGGRAIVAAFAVMLVCYFLPDPFAFRINKSFTPFLAFLVVAGAGDVGLIVTRVVRRSGSAPVLFQRVAQLGMIGAVLPSFVVPLMESASFPARLTVYPRVAEVEYNLATWFEENTDERARIISDSQTMLLITSLGNRVSITERKFLLEEMSPSGYEQMTFVKEDILTAPTGCAAYAGIQSLSGTEPAPEQRYLRAIGATTLEPAFFVVWTPKTYLWATRPGRIDPVLSPVPVTTMPWWEEGITPFRDSRFFRQVGQIGSEAYIFEALPAGELSAAALSGCAPAAVQTSGGQSK